MCDFTREEGRGGAVPARAIMIMKVALRSRSATAAVNVTLLAPVVFAIRTEEAAEAEEEEEECISCAILRVR